MRCFCYAGLLRDFVQIEGMRQLRVLEINPAGGLTQFLQELPGHVFGSYPEVDMMALPYVEGVFDLLVHSDTLEHVEYLLRGLSECRRVLRPGGYCAFTVPLVLDRLTASRAGLPHCYHGSPANPADCLVHTEYGADVWKHVIQAGFPEC